MQVEGQHGSSLLLLMATGARVRNAYRTWPIHGDSLLKGRLIPGGPIVSHEMMGEDLSVWDGGA